MQPSRYGCQSTPSKTLYSFCKATPALIIELMSAVRQVSKRHHLFPNRIRTRPLPYLPSQSVTRHSCQLSKTNYGRGLVHPSRFVQKPSLRTQRIRVRRWWLWVKWVVAQMRDVHGAKEADVRVRTDNRVVRVEAMATWRHTADAHLWL